jgi:hypothetical protein
MSNTPKILWSQKKTNINLKICLSGYSNVNFDLIDNNINFNCESGNLNYTFSFQTFKGIKDYTIYESGNSINITLNKIDSEWWSKLTENKNYKNHIKVDWDKWIDEDDIDDNDDSEHSNFDLGNMQEMMKMMQNMGGQSDNCCSPGNYINDEETTMCSSSNIGGCSSGCCSP